MKCPFVIIKCSKCKKLLVAYFKNFSKKNGGKHNLRSYCKICEKKQKKNYKEKNKEKLNEYYNQWKRNNLEHFNEYQKKYREENIENKRKIDKLYYESHKEEILEYRKQYYKENPEITFNSNCRRRSKEENQGNGISKEQWLDMMNFFDWKCAYSDEYIGNDSKHRTIDHIIPLDKNGEHEIWNCVPMYASYNYSKKNKDWLEWYIQQEFYSEERLNKIYEWIEYAKNKYKNN